MGWWNDEEEPFHRHWQNLITALKPISQDTIFLMGDFNNRSDIKDEGYNLILKDKWYDLYELAQIRDEGITSSSGIAGWFSQNSEAIRIDYIFAIKNKCTVSKSIFTGIDKPTISDHFAVLTECTKGV